MASIPRTGAYLLPLAGSLAAALIISPKSTTFADEGPLAQVDIRKRKPIYDSPSSPSLREIASTTPAPASGVTDKPREKASDDASPPTPKRPSPTDRVAEQVRQTRLFIHRYAARAEDSVNAGMNKVLHAEHDFTSTIASLAPPKESNEKLLPGSIYVLVAAMAGSIISRNRNILFRFVTPLITGATAAHYLIPRTTQNVEDLIWKFESRYPVIRDNHLRASERVRHFIETGKAHSQMGLAMAEDKIHGVREAVEDLVRKGR